jgi:hypothetical protein
MTPKPIACVLAFILLITPRARAAPSDHFVTADGSGNTCTQAAPCALTTALDLAEDGDAIYVAQGTYTGTGSAVVTITQSIALYGGWDGATTTPIVRDPRILPILDGEGARRVIHISGMITPTIDGFWITGGYKVSEGGGIYVHNASPRIQHNYIVSNGTTSPESITDSRGGGIFIDGVGSPIITHNKLYENAATYGSGIYHDGGNTAAATITHNAIKNNAFWDTFTDTAGGGLFIDRAPDLVKHNLIEANGAARGAGIYIWAAAPRIEANRMLHNEGYHDGSGLAMGNNAKPTLVNNWFINSRLYVTHAAPEVVNNTITGGNASRTGHAIHIEQVSCYLPYCLAGTYLNNIISGYEVGIYGEGPILPVIDFNNLWANNTDYDLPDGVKIGAHNIGVDPLFVRGGSDYHLQDASPCVNAGDPSGLPPAPPSDIDGHPRPADGRVDIGADEVPLRVLLPLTLR